MNTHFPFEDDPIPEGLEFQESYMQDAFRMYDAEKKSRRRMVFFWWFTAGSVLITTGVIAAVALFGSTNIESDRHRVSKEGSSSRVKTTSSPEKQLFTQSSGKQLSDGAAQVAPEKEARNVVQRVYKTRGGFDQPTGVFGMTPLTNDEIDVQPAYYKPQAPQRSACMRTSLLSGITPENWIKLQEPNRQDSSVNPDVAAKADSISFPWHYDSLRPHTVYLSLGTNVLFGLQDLTGGLHFREAVGLGYTYQFKPHWFIGGELSYHTVSRMNYTRYLGESTDYGQTYSLKTTLNFIGLRPLVGYNLNNRHRFTFGLGFDYLMPDAEQSLSNRALNVSQEDANKYSKADYYGVYSRFNVDVSLGYQFRITRYAEVGISYMYGLSDVTKSGYGTTNFDRNSRLQLAVRFRLY